MSACEQVIRGRLQESDSDIVNDQDHAVVALDMVEHYRRLSSLKNVKTFSTRGIKRMFLASAILFFLAFAGMLALLILKK